ncbi:hypothetical protein CCP2SC5_690005 [Azospirillaceae bacterium]
MKKEILIDLNNYSSDPKKVDDKYLFQQEAMDRAKNLIARLIEEKNLNNREYRVHNSITVNGGRGSGKTMFMLNLIKTLQNPEEDALKGVEIVPTIDPTLIENKENIVLTVLARIYEICQDKNGQCRCPPQGGDDDKAFAKVETTLKDLSSGLSLLDGVGKKEYYGDEWSDSNYVVRRGMQAAIQGVKLEEKIHRFVSDALEYLKKKAFLLVFDDIDTQFLRGWPVLEAIRKYFTTPKIIVLLSGDLGLYNKLVRCQQFENFGEMMLRYDRPSHEYHALDTKTWGSDQIIRMVDRLTEQYIIKILKPENQLRLLTLGYIDRFQKDSRPLKVCYGNYKGDDGEEIKDNIDLENVLQKIIQFVFCTEKEFSIYKEAILEQPVRAVIQFLVGARDLLACQKGSFPASEAQVFADRLVSVFSASLYQYGLDPQIISRATPHGLIDQLLTWLSEARVWNSGYHLKPTYADNSLNQVAMVLGAYFTRKVNQSLSDALDYMLKIVWTRELIFSLSNGKKRSLPNEDAPSR